MNIHHEPRKIPLASAIRLSRVLGTRGFPRLHHIWHSGPPNGYGGQASHDCSWFGFVGNISLGFSPGI